MKKDIEAQADQAHAEFLEIKESARRIIRHPVESLLPVAIGPLLGSVTRGLRSAPKSSD